MTPTPRPSYLGVGVLPRTRGDAARASAPPLGGTLRLTSLLMGLRAQRGRSSAEAPGNLEDPPASEGDYATLLFDTGGAAAAPSPTEASFDPVARDKLSDLRRRKMAARCGAPPLPDVTTTQPAARLT